ncbi:hypothetical protein [Elongatibacter sediminis]
MKGLPRIAKVVTLIVLSVMSAMPAYAAEEDKGKWEAPWRVLLRAGVIDGWAAASPEYRQTVIMPEYNEVHRLWKEMGVTMIGTIDDYLTQAGTPGSRHYGWYELYEVNELSTVGKMLDLIRHSQLGEVHLDKYMRYDALIGTPQTDAEQVFGLQSQ